MAKKVAGELYESITGQLFEIGRQLRQPKGYPFDPGVLQKYLQNAIEGRFNQVIKVVTPDDKILEFVSTVTVSATTKKFVVRDYVQKLRKTKNVYASSNFEKLFFDKTVEPISEQELNYHKLTKNSVDGPIIDELGGEAKVETTLAEMFSLIALQPNGEDGVSLTNGYANVFYIRDVVGVLRAVCCYWHDVGWNLSAFSVELPYAWYDGRQVFSRNSCES
ncbi:hypothetical protein KJ934_01610 [Patescibacteria group bacterium]|nr:hypothetical protein [Patescibacteria group bacterium]MBU4477440.1 hypothetical protein [Patescibacteria group bacterium]MCG2699397.1 hypothetical protein [Candidatus Parcubacteria bacterium]